MRIAVYTLGCKVNQCETQALERNLVARGHDLVPFEGEADAYIINTCTVTAASDKKCRLVIRHTRKRAPNGVVAVCGCYAQMDPKAVAALGVDMVIGTDARGTLLDEVERVWGVRQKKGSAPLPRQDTTGKPSPSPAKRTRAMLKVEDGCVNFCSYCIIPYARGAVRSLPLAQAVAQAVALAQAGYQELVLTGIEISSWGQDIKNGTGLIELMEAVSAAAPTLRLRLGSLEPRTITEDFCRRAAALPNLCPHFHLSMQAGCDSVLKRMNRKYDTARYYESVALLRQHFCDPAITTDLIVCFPGEGEEEFAQTLAFVEKCAFSSLHIFPYSRRPGTPAADMAGQASNALKEERARRAGTLAQALEEAYLARQVGKVVPVLFEGGTYTLAAPNERPSRQREEAPTVALWRGHAPNYVTVYAKGQKLHNEVRPVRILAVQGDGLLGELVE